MKFSILFFSDTYNNSTTDPYEMVLELAKYGDQNGFTAVWLPERHFHTMGGIYPNPAVIAAFLAAKTQKIRLRAGSIVAPLHHPASIVEAWAVVDNLSAGRVDVAIASGWNVNDFVLSPSTYADLRQVWLERIPQIRDLWRGANCTFANGRLEPVPVRVYPRPIQTELNIWLTISKQADSFQKAGEMGLNVLTMLAGSTLQQLADKIQIYRRARQHAGHDPAAGTVTLMLHSFVHEDLSFVHQVVRAPFSEYIKASLRSHLQGGAVKVDQPMSEREINKMAEYSFERYFSTAALFGTVDDARRMVENVRSAGVDEIACQLDFGPGLQEIRQGLPYLTQIAAECVHI